MATVAAGAAFLAVSGMANGPGMAPVHAANAGMLVAQAEVVVPDATSSAAPEGAPSAAPDATSSAESSAASSSESSAAPVAAAKATYTAEQSDRGKNVFLKDCTDCHGKDLRGGLLGGPPLRGLAFEEKYGKGSPAGVLFEVMSTTMPPNDPGRYSDPTYADIMAYILKTNGYKAGAELPSDVDALYELVIEK
jgi:mono/diheme cytochrome c family protein